VPNQWVDEIIVVDKPWADYMWLILMLEGNLWASLGNNFRQEKSHWSVGVPGFRNLDVINVIGAFACQKPSHLYMNPTQLRPRLFGA